jgi:hypothetical protein
MSRHQNWLACIRRQHTKVFAVSRGSQFGACREGISLIQWKVGYADQLTGSAINVGEVEVTEGACNPATGKLIISTKLDSLFERALVS